MIFNVPSAALRASSSAALDLASASACSAGVLVEYPPCARSPIENQ